ncbi:flippase-like domain-containing protein [Kushneria sp. AK178]
MSAGQPRPTPGSTPGYRRLLNTSMLRWTLTLLLLGSVIWLVDHDALLARLSDLSPAWLSLALLISVPQIMLSAWRWRLTVRHMGMSLPLPTAISEYYLSTFLNQMLPGGVTGDLGRAWRHGTRQVSHGAALRAVIIERASGQAALLLVALITLLLFTPLRHGLVERLSRAGLMLHEDTEVPHTLIYVTVMAVLLAGVWVHRHPPYWLSALRRDLRRGLWNRRLWLRQLMSSLAIVMSYMLVFVCCARALGEPLSTTVLLALTPPVLMAMAIPLSVAGWGIRESAAALIWILAGLPAQQGVAISMTYGAVILLSSLPGAVVLLLGRHVTFRQLFGRG